MTCSRGLSVSHTNPNKPAQAPGGKTHFSWPADACAQRGGHFVIGQQAKEAIQFHAKSRPGLWSSILYLSLWLEPRIQPLALSRACLGIFFTSTFFCALEGGRTSSRSGPYPSMISLSLSISVSSFLPPSTQYHFVSSPSCGFR